MNKRKLLDHSAIVSCQEPISALSLNVDADKNKALYDHYQDTGELRPEGNYFIHDSHDKALQKKRTRTALRARIRHCIKNLPEERRNDLYAQESERLHQALQYTQGKIQQLEGSPESDNATLLNLYEQLIDQCNAWFEFMLINDDYIPALLEARDGYTHWLSPEANQINYAITDKIAQTAHIWTYPINPARALSNPTWNPENINASDKIVQESRDWLAGKTSFLANADSWLAQSSGINLGRALKRLDALREKNPLYCFEKNDDNQAVYKQALSIAVSLLLGKIQQLDQADHADITRKFAQMYKERGQRYEKKNGQTIIGSSQFSALIVNASEPRQEGQDTISNWPREIPTVLSILSRSLAAINPRLQKLYQRLSTDRERLVKNIVIYRLKVVRQAL